MIVTMRLDATEEQAQRARDRIHEFGLETPLIQGESRTVIAALGQVLQEYRDEMQMFDGVEEVLRVSERMREVASLSTAVDHLEAVYEELIKAWPDSRPLDRPRWTEQLESLVADETECNQSPIFAAAMVALAKRLSLDRP